MPIKSVLSRPRRPFLPVLSVQLLLRRYYVPPLGAPAAQQGVSESTPECTVIAPEGDPAVLKSAFMSFPESVLAALEGISRLIPKFLSSRREPTIGHFCCSPGGHP